MSPGYCDNGLRADGGYQFTSEASRDNKIATPCSGVEIFLWVFEPKCYVYVMCFGV